MRLYNIAGLTIGLDFPGEYIHQSMQDFLAEEADSHDFIPFYLHTDEKSAGDFLPAFKEQKPLVSSPYVVIYSDVSGFMMFYQNSGGLSCCRIGTAEPCADIYAETYVQPACGDCKGHDVSNVCAGCPSQAFPQLSLCEHLFFCIRDIFFVFMQLNGGLAVHSSSILYNGRAYLFSAPSGTGKTTHTGFWEDCYGAEILDGDVTAVRMNGGRPEAYGLPWCGTSGKYKNASAPLAMIIFIRRHEANEISGLTLFEATIQLAARCFTPSWNSALAERNFSLAQQIAESAECVTLKCLPEESAARLLKEYIDKSSKDPVA